MIKLSFNLILIYAFIFVNPLFANQNDFKKILGSKQDGFFFISKSSIKPKNSKIFFTYLHNLPNKTEYGDASYIVFVEAKCKNYNYRTLGSKWFSQIFAAGIINAEYNDDCTWQNGRAPGGYVLNKTPSFVVRFSLLVLKVPLSDQG